MSSLDTDDALTHHRIVAYDQKYAARYGHKSAIILRRLEFWFSKKPDGFYKFMEPCQHKLYRAGDSWYEETDLSRRVFMTAFINIGQRYKSKSAFLKEVDPFKGCLYACYYDRKTNRMYFIRNHDLANRLTQAATITTKAKASIGATSQRLKQISTDSQRSGIERRSCNDTPSRSFAWARNNEISHKKDITSSIPRCSVATNPCQTKHDLKSSAEEMIEIWKTEIGELHVQGVTTHIVRVLLTALLQRFDNNLSLWQQYCRLIASSKFLMGEEGRARHFNGARIDWAAKLSTIDRIRNGEFTLGDRQPRQHLKEIYDSYTELETRLSCDEKAEVDQKIRFELLQRVGAAAYKAWFENIHIEQTLGNVIELRAKSAFKKNHLDIHFGPIISAVEAALELKIRLCI